MEGVFAIAAAIAARQHGRVTRAQLLAAGIDGKRIERWLADGRLRRVHLGVYAVGHLAPSMHGDYTLRCSPGVPAPSSPARRPRMCSS